MLAPSLERPAYKALPASWAARARPEARHKDPRALRKDLPEQRERNAQRVQCKERLAPWE